MREFDSMLAFSRFLVERIPMTVLAFHHSLKKIGEGIEKTAKSEFGEYQPAVGPWSAWPALSEATQEQRVQQGFSADEPLLRSGELRDAVTHDVDGANLEVAIGVKSGTAHTPYADGSGAADIGDIMIWHELGTAKMPPRSVLGPALARNRELIEREVGAALLMGLVSPRIAPP